MGGDYNLIYLPFFIKRLTLFLRGGSTAFAALSPFRRALLFICSSPLRCAPPRIWGRGGFDCADVVRVLRVAKGAFNFDCKGFFKDF